MNTLQRNFIFTLGLAVLFNLVLPKAGMATETEITRALKGTIEQVVQIVYDEELKKIPEFRRVLIRKAINKRFNYNQMAARALAKNWNSRSVLERQEFVLRFRDILERSYTQKIESFANGKIRFTGVVVRGKYALVKTRIERKDKSIDLDYKMIRQNGEWTVYDILDRGVSMIRNYRQQLAKTLKRESFGDLLKKMAKSEEGFSSEMRVSFNTRTELKKCCAL